MPLSPNDPSGASADLVVIGAGIVGAACALAAARVGLRVALVDRGSVAGGTTGAGEGNLLVSDKEPGPELDLMLHSLRRWREFADLVGADTIELEPKGGLVVAADAGSVPPLRELADRHRAAGVSVTDVDGRDLAEHEPALAPGLAGGAHYSQDMQVQPMLAAAQLVRTASRDHGVAVVLGRAVTGIDHGADGRVTAVRTTAGRIATPAVVNAAGVWAADIGRLAGVDLPVTPRRGFILVTQPLPAVIRHKVYAADYMTAVASDTGELLTSAVIEGTRAGTVLIGSSRERVGFDGRVALPALRRLAAQAVRLFPVLGRAHVLRAYHGFRPYSPDHLPLIGPDPRRPGLLHACGHEGAGIGLAPATGDLIAAMLTGAAAPVDPHPFRPSRFAGGESDA